MAMQPPRLRRRLLGYSPPAVNEVLSSWDAMIRRANGRTRTAEAAAAETRTELLQNREQIARKDREVEGLRRQVQSLQEQVDRSRRQATENARRGELTAKIVAEEAAGLLKAAEETAARIVDRAQSRSEHRVQEVQRLWSDVGTHMARVSSWHERIEPVLRGAQGKLHEAAARIEEVPERIREALTPIFASFEAAREDLARVAEITSPPVVVLPEEIDSDGEAQTEQAPTAHVPAEQLVGQPASGYDSGGAVAAAEGQPAYGPQAPVASEANEAPPTGRPQPGTGT